MAAGFMTHVTCRLTAKYWDQLRNPTLGDRVWAAFTFLHRLPRPIAIDVASSGVCVRHAEEPIVSRLGGGDLSENHVCRLGPGAEWESAVFTETVDSSSSRARRGGDQYDTVAMRLIATITAAVCYYSARTPVDW